MITGHLLLRYPRERSGAELIHTPSSRDWLVVYDAPAIKGFYEGTKRAAAHSLEHLGRVPLLRWLAFLRPRST